MSAMKSHSTAPMCSDSQAQLTCLETRLDPGRAQLSPGGLSVISPVQLGPISTFLCFPPDSVVHPHWGWRLCDLDKKLFVCFFYHFYFILPGESIHRHSVWYPMPGAWLGRRGSVTPGPADIFPWWCGKRMFPGCSVLFHSGPSGCSGRWVCSVITTPAVFCMQHAWLEGNKKDLKWGENLLIHQISRGTSNLGSQPAPQARETRPV